MKKYTVEDIAKVCHEVNRAFCQTVGDDSQPSWETAPNWHHTSTINQVNFQIENPDAQSSHTHIQWMNDKIQDGWKYGPVKDAVKKEHPCMVPYDELPIEQKMKDTLILNIVNTLKVLL